MFEIGLTLLFVAMAGVVGLALRRRSAPRPSLASRVEPLPAGVKHLASTVSDLSDLGMHLPAATRALARKRRLGLLLGLR
ncbi:MAG TPA: hypothetical protein VIW03_05265 [Anaeromyxobacter sp.]